MPEPGRSAAAGRGGAEIAEREKIRTALRLAEVAWRDFDRRRAYEWKVNFALWPALGAVSGFFWKGSQNLDAFPAVSISILLMIIGCIYWFKWSVGLWERNKFDQDTAQDHRLGLTEIRLAAGLFPGRNPVRSHGQMRGMTGGVSLGVGPMALKLSSP